MNKLFKWLFVAVMFASMCACSSEDAIPQSSQVETSLVRFSFFDTSMEKLDDFTRSTRAGEVSATEWKKTFNRLDIAIFPQGKAKNDTVYLVHQTSEEKGFGQLSIRLPIGSYRMVAVASKAAKPVDITSAEVVTFPDKTVTDMAYVSQSIEVKSGTTTANCILKRSLSKFKLQSTDRVTKDFSKIEVNYSGFFSDTFNPSTGYGIKEGTENAWQKAIVFERYGGTVGINIFLLIPDEKVTMKVTVNVYDTNNQMVRSLTFDNVVLQQNHVTTYTGPLFSSGSTFEFTFDNKELDKSDYDHEFGD